MMSVSQSYVWYVGYGSNLCEERFLCYILGEKFKWGGKKADACKDKTPPKANKPIRIPYSLYFAKNSCWWEDSGVAFISPEREPDENKWTLGRMWKITCEQYEHVRRQEGKDWYNHEIYLEEEDGFPIRTITNKEILTSYNRPSAGYLKTIGQEELGSALDTGQIQQVIEKNICPQRQISSAKRLTFKSCFAGFLLTNVICNICRRIYLW